MIMHNAVMIAGYYLYPSITLWLALSFITVTPTAYFLHSRYTFSTVPDRKSFAKYILAMTASIPMAFVTIWFWHDQLHLPMAFAAPLASVCTLVMNFVLSRWAIFTRPRHLPMR